ncbi:hypothetical protein JTE90_005717 [Oedothorax gibbosus]|uniref:Uncharacterized protein n=1 Tax=Oedothorax gibbosus TaxID=931172 RepID=A0AAV6ULK3_9ARAC|nr:hypothetical protein JTE90_005717 [Oedothorax gibbosus]
MSSDSNVDAIWWDDGKSVGNFASGNGNEKEVSLLGELKNQQVSLKHCFPLIFDCCRPRPNSKKDSPKEQTPNLAQNNQNKVDT